MSEFNEKIINKLKSLERAIERLKTWEKPNASATPTPNTIPIADANGKLDGWVTGGSGGGIEEAPNDGKQYGRKSLGWTEIVSGSGEEGVTPTVRTFASGYGSSNIATIVVPATAGVGDTLIIFVGSNYAASSVTAGWNFLNRTNGGWHNVTAVAKTCESGDIGSTITVTLLGNEPWNIACVVVADATAFTGSAVNRAENGNSLGSGSAIGVKVGNLCLFYGTARVGSQTLTFDSGTAIFTRNSDATLSSTFWAGNLVNMFALSTILTSPSATQGLGVVFIGFG